MQSFAPKQNHTSIKLYCIQSLSIPVSVCKCNLHGSDVDIDDDNNNNNLLTCLHWLAQ